MLKWPLVTSRRRVATAPVKTIVISVPTLREELRVLTRRLLKVKAQSIRMLKAAPIRTGTNNNNDLAGTLAKEVVVVVAAAPI